MKTSDAATHRGFESHPFRQLQKAGSQRNLLFYIPIYCIRILGEGIPALLAMEKVRRVAPLTEPDRIADRSDTGTDTVFALFRYFIDTGFVIVQKVLRAELWNGNDRHEHVGPGL